MPIEQLMQLWANNNIYVTTKMKIGTTLLFIICSESCLEK